MENKTTLKEEIGEVVRGVVQEEIKLLKAGIDKRFNKVDSEIKKLGIEIIEMDGKFSTITEGQDIIRDVLETRVAHIEEILGVEVGV